MNKISNVTENGKEKAERIILWLLLFVVYCIWNAYFPMTSDDLYWKYGVNVSSVEDIWRETLYMGNGRILGNFGIMVLVRFPLLKVLYKSVFMCLLPYLFIRVLDISKKYLKILCVILTMFPGNYMFAQIYVWTSGFQNYFPPMVLFLSCLLVLKRSKEKLSIRAGIYLMLCSVVEMLFLETAALMMIEVAVIAVILAWRQKANKRATGVFLFGSLVGLSILFGLPHFVKSSEKIDGYRQIGDSSLRGIIQTAVSHAEKFVQTISGCSFLIILLSVVLIFILLKGTEDERRTVGHNLAIGGLVSFPIYSILNIYFIKQWVFTGGWNVYVTLFWFAFYIIAVGWVIWTRIREYRELYTLLLFLALFSFAPMLIVSTVRERNCYISYLYFVALLLLLLENMQLSDLLLRWFRNGCIVAILSIILVMFMICAEWDYVSYMRNKYCNRMAENHETIICLPALPHSQLLQADADPNYWKYYTDSEFGYDVKIEFVEWYSWLNIK